RYYRRSSLVEKPVREPAAEVDRVRERSARTVPQDAATILAHHERAHLEHAAVHPRVRGDGCHARRPQAREQRALCQGGGARHAIVEGSEARTDPLVVAAHFESEHALTDGRNERFDRQPFDEWWRDAQSMKPCRGQHDGVTVSTLELSEPRVDVA